MGGGWLAQLGVFILWFGWFGFNPGSTLSGMNPGIGLIAVTTNLAAAAGAVSALVFNWFRTGKPSTEVALNGVLAGLVAVHGFNGIQALGTGTISVWAFGTMFALFSLLKVTTGDAHEN